MFSLKKQPARPSRRRSRTVQKASRQRRPTFEPLEDRRLLAVSPEWLATIGGDATLDLPQIAGHFDGGFSVTGYFNGTHDFDPGPSETLLASGRTPFGGYNDGVVARYNEGGELLWARQITGNPSVSFQQQSGVGVATDRLGNTYLIGNFSYSIQIGSQSFTGDGSDGFVTKLDADGNFVWAQAIYTSSTGDGPRGVTVDDSDANPANWSVFIAGHYSGQATLGGQTITSGKGKSVTIDTYVSKLSASTGSFQWTQNIGGQGPQVAQKLAFATTGAAGLYISGDFETEAKIGNVTLTGPAGSHFLAKLNPATGATVWAKSVAVAAHYGSLGVTDDGVVVAGNFSGTVDFDPGAGVYNLTSIQAVDSGVLKLDPNGNFVWARRMGGNTNNALATQGLSVNADGHVFVTGHFRNTADFGNQTFTTAAGTEGYLVELDAAGTFVSAYQFSDGGYSTAVDGSGNVYVTGHFDLSEPGNFPFNSFPTGEHMRNSRGVALLKFSSNAPPLDPTPSIQTFVAAQETVIAGEPVVLSVDRYRDLDRQVQNFNFYRDNGDGVLNPVEDELVGSDSSSLGGWSVAASTVGLPAGTYRYFAEATDGDGVALAHSLPLEVTVAGIEVVNYVSPNVPKAIPVSGSVTSTITVPESFSILDVNLKLDISHTRNADLSAFLIAPDGTSVTLFLHTYLSGQNLTGTTLDDEAAIAIANGTAPYTGSFRTSSNVVNLGLATFDGKNAAGVWTLDIRDLYKSNKGTLHSWSLQFTRAAAPMALAGGAAAAAGESDGGTAFVSTTTVTSTTSRSTSGPKASAAPSSRPANNLLLAMDLPRRLTSDSVDSVMTDLPADELASTGDSQDDELLAALAGV